MWTSVWALCLHVLPVRIYCSHFTTRSAGASSGLSLQVVIFSQAAYGILAEGAMSEALQAAAVGRLSPYSWVMSPCTILLSEIIWLFKTKCSRQMALVCRSSFYLPSPLLTQIPFHFLISCKSRPRDYFLIFLVVLINSFVAFPNRFVWHLGKQATEHHWRLGPQEGAEHRAVAAARRRGRRCLPWP